MDSHKDLESLEEENRVLCDRLATFEDELARRDDALEEYKGKNKELMENLRKYQHKVKELERSLEESEAADCASRGNTGFITTNDLCCYS